MSLPALRQPKSQQKLENDVKTPISDEQFILLTLEEGQKLVLPSDFYNGILKVEDMYKCVYCKMTMVLDPKFKELHIESEKHSQAMETVPYVEELCEGNLMKHLNFDQTYCVICNVVVATPFLNQHLTSEVHQLELEKAIARVVAYTPV